MGSNQKSGHLAQDTSNQRWVWASRFCNRDFTSETYLAVFALFCSPVSFPEIVLLPLPGERGGEGKSLSGLPRLTGSGSGCL